MKRKLFWLFLAMLLFLLPAGAAAADTEGASHSASDSDVTITITTDKKEYAAGEQINYTITIENNRTYWNINSFEFEYSNTEGLLAAYDGSMPTAVPQVKYGESYELTGVLIGDPAVFPVVETTPTAVPSAGEESPDASDGSGKEGSENPASSGEGGSETPDGSGEEQPTAASAGVTLAVILGVAVLIAAAVVIVLLVKGGKKGGKAGKTMMMFLLAFFLLLPSAAAVTAYAVEYETITLRPYIKVNYGGEEITIRAVMELHMLQERVRVKVSQQDNPRRITCHDPSIFRDFDGTYYVFGTHINGGYSSDLRNWTSIEGAFRLSFTEEVKEQIRAWNKEADGGDWFGNLWAPDIIYNEAMKKYCIYLSANGDDWKSNIVLLTSDNVTGPYDYAGTVVYGGFTPDDWLETDVALVTGTAELPERYIVDGIKNARWGRKWPNCIDPCVFYDDEGKLWMAYGSWFGGIFMLELDEETGLRDYTVSYEINEHSDEYFGTKIAGGVTSSGEGAYIEKIGDYYWLFISYGWLEAAGGYNIRVYRSDRPDGGYVDALGNDAYFETFVHNYNMANKGVRLFGGYKWRTFTYADVAQGHNSAFVDEDGRAYIVYHTRTSNGTEGHTVKVLQLFLNKEGWLCAAPYQTSGEKLDASRLNMADYAGQYEVILHKLDIDYENLESMKPVFVQFSEDGTLTGDMTGTWALEEGTSYITLVLEGVTYSGVALHMNVENTEVETSVFTALGQENQLTIWGSKTIEFE